MRVALFLPHFAITGGLGVHCRTLLNALLHTHPNDQFTVFTPADPQSLFPTASTDESWRQAVEDRRVSHVPVDCPPGFSLAGPLDRVLAEPVAASRADVLACTYYTGMQHPPCPQAVVFHDAGFLENPAGFGDTARVRKETVELIRPAITKLVCVSADARDRICRHLPFDPARTAVVWHALTDTPEAIRIASDPVRKYEPLWTGGDCPADWGQYLFVPVGAATGFNRARKNVPAAVTAFRQLARTKTRLVIASTGTLSDRLLAELLPADELKGGSNADRVWRSADGRVIVLPNLIRSPFLAAMAHANGIVYPTRYEGFGLPAIEAMALGVPLVAGRATSLPEVVGNAGLLVDPDDLWGFTGAMGVVLDDQKARDELIRRGRDRVKLFSLDRMGEQMRAVLTQLLQTNGERPVV